MRYLNKTIPLPNLIDDTRMSIIDLFYALRFYIKAIVLSKRKYFWLIDMYMLIFNLLSTLKSQFKKIG